MATPSISQEEKRITVEEFEGIDDLGRAELVRGKIVKMGPPKSLPGKMVSNFTHHLNLFVRENTLGIIVAGETGVLINNDPGTVRGMDVAFISSKRWARQTDTDGYLKIAPDLIVEILSPSDRWNDVMDKLQDYFSIGVPLIWIADPESKTVNAYRSLTDISIFYEIDILNAGEILPGFEIPVKELFE